MKKLVKSLWAFLLLALCSFSIFPEDLSKVSTTTLLNELKQNELLILSLTSEQWKNYKALEVSYEIVSTELDELKLSLQKSNQSLETALILQSESASQVTETFKLWTNSVEDLEKAQKNNLWYFVGGIVVGGLLIYAANTFI